ncbi:MAG TPA: pyridoxamine 5'-phosphate oxidase family protein [Burkholderiales bacterium]|nr:pyridoxamine 5'-phosphate oxidase family protein [Burkholderiales bacterium]HSA71958.1 pyridoxamine 5'-phosphate oxidase family protein [Burkholderiales bacterium]
MIYHEGARRLQDRFDSRRLADRLVEKLWRTAFTAEDKAFIEASPMFFLATADASGQPDCSYKGGLPGFVRVTGPSELSFPSYDGNGMFRSLGNVLANPRVGMLFLDFEQPRRLRVNGHASLVDDVSGFEGAQLVVRIAADAIFPNCPRYIHRYRLLETSVYAPRPGYEPPAPGWKKNFSDVLPHGRKGDQEEPAD